LRKFGTIYADPPWPYTNVATRAAAADHYSTMSIKDICNLKLTGLGNLPVREYAAPKSHLHLWTTNAFLYECKEVLEAWGFEYKGVFVWVKSQMGIGNYWRVSHEFLVLGVRGTLSFRDKGIKSWIEHARLTHSEKPEAIRKLVERVSPAPRLELFARKLVPHWTVWGDEVPSLNARVNDVRKKNP